MRDRALTDYLFIVGTIALTVYGQLVLKWQVGLAGSLPVETAERIWFVVRLLLSPWVVSAFAAAFLASLSWMGAMSRFQLSYAYPFTSLSFALILILSVVLFREPVTLFKVLGLGLIVAGVVVASQG